MFPLQVVVLVQILASELNFGYNFSTIRCHSFNGNQLHNLQHLAQLVDRCEDRLVSECCVLQMHRWQWRTEIFPLRFVVQCQNEATAIENMMKYSQTVHHRMPRILCFVIQPCTNNFCLWAAEQIVPPIQCCTCTSVPQVKILSNMKGSVTVLGLICQFILPDTGRKMEGEGEKF